jgi:Domain of unknown function (DUF4384)
MNSWGRSWGEGGYVWVKYEDYSRCCLMAFQPFGDPNSPLPKFNNDFKPSPNPNPNPNPNPTPNPIPIPTPTYDPTFVLKGNVEFKQNTGELMLVNRIASKDLIDSKKKTKNEDLVAYRMDKSYISGTKFRFFISTTEQAYIYAFATDLTGKVNRILPYEDLISTHLGANSVVAFPSEKKVVKMDETKGTDFMLILYSTEPIVSKSIAEKMNAIKGSLSQKIKIVLGDKLIDKDLINYFEDSIGFEFSSKKSGGIVPLMVEISHE